MEKRRGPQVRKDHVFWRLLKSFACRPVHLGNEPRLRALVRGVIKDSKALTSIFPESMFASTNTGRAIMTRLAWASDTWSGWERSLRLPGPKPKRVIDQMHAGGAGRKR